jgi:protein TonB
MKTKKTIKANIEKKKFLFLEIGLILSLSLCLFAFEWTSYDVKNTNLGDLTTSIDIEQDVITVNIPKPIPPSNIKNINPEVIIITDKLINDSVDMFNSELIDSVSPIIHKVVIDIPDEVVEVIPWVNVETKPIFTGGEVALLSYISKNTTYPEISKENGIDGRVYVQFVIGCDGYVTNITIVKGVDKYLDAEALRVISTLPKWEPGKQRGKNVPVSFIIPINFILN